MRLPPEDSQSSVLLLQSVGVTFTLFFFNMNSDVALLKRLLALQLGKELDDFFF